MLHLSKIASKIRAHLLVAIAVSILSFFIISTVFTFILLHRLTDYSDSYSQIPEPSYAGEITESILTARNQTDFQKYLDYYSSDSQKFLTKQMFESDVDFVKFHWGDYIPNSKVVKSAWLHKTHGMRFIEVYYYAKFTNKPNENIPIMIDFIEIEGKPYVQGDNFNVTSREGNIIIINGK